MDRWEECLTAWKKSTNGKLDSKASQHIVWRARGATAAQMQAELLKSAKLDESEISALFRALDLQDADARQKALRMLLDLAAR